MLPDTIRRHPNVDLILDKRTIKVKSGNSFSDYIKTKCWGDLCLNTGINCHYDESDRNEGIWVADWMANFIWRKYENGHDPAYNILNANSGQSFFQKTLFM